MIHLARRLARRDRGERWVLAQIVVELLFAGSCLVGPRLPRAFRSRLRVSATMCAVLGGVVFGASALKLGRQLTPLPRPADAAELVAAGPYRFVRHPLYSGLLLASVGIALLSGRWLAWPLTAVAAVFYDAKASEEERWLSRQFSDYPLYRSRVPKLVPWLN